MIGRLRREERGQASAELLGMVWWLLFAAVCVWQLMLGAWTTTQTANAARTASRVDARGGDAEKAARNALPGPLRDGFDAGRFRMRGEEATVVVRIPIIVPGLTVRGLHAERSVTLPET